VAMRGGSSGHDPASEYFWGDLAKKHIRYVRQFTFQDINLLDVNPSLPYRRADTPYVNYWFQTSNGGNRDAFVKLLSSENLDRLARDHGVCLVYAHLGAGSFSANGRVNSQFEERIKDLASRNGWFVPASEILDYLTKQPGWTGETIGFRERLQLETKFSVSRVLYGVP
jgi:hypothetical protein